jgi:glycine/D-amino acid oxidase-like deaminating enzyme
MKTTPYWADDSPRPNDLPVSILPGDVDVLVVGSGYTGLAAACELAASGLEVAVVDRGEIGSGASSRNGGQLNYGLKAATTAVFKRYGPAVGRRLWDASLDAIDLVEGIVEREEIDAEFSRDGAAELAFRPEDYPALAAEAGWMRDNLGFDTELIPADRMDTVIGSEAFAVALVDGAGASIHPAKYVFGLAAAAVRHGAVLVEHAGVATIARSGSGFLITTAAGPVRARNVLMATNGYTPTGLVPQLRRRVVPVGSYMIATAPLDARTAERLIPGNRILWTANNLLNYIRRSSDDRILIGGRQNLSPDLDLVESAHDLRSTLTRFFPELADVEITQSWGGNLGLTFDLLPHVGRIDGIWHALGYGGHGVGLATYLGTEAGRLIAGRAESSPFAEIPFPDRFFYREKPWFLPLAAGWYRLRDRIGR